MIPTSKIRVAVLRGGPSSEYDVSLKTGGEVLSHLRGMSEMYEPVDILISRDGEWHLEGLVHEPHDVLRHVDVAWNALHGPYGEDGQVQKILEGLKIPFTGSGTVASALSMNKDMAKRLYRRHDLPTPRHELIAKADLNHDQLIYIFQNYLPPVIVKPASAGSSIGIRLAYSYKELEEAIKEALTHSTNALMEEFIEGKEVTCGVIDHFRDERHYALMPVEIEKPSDKKFFDYDAKYDGKTREICPANITSDEQKEVEAMSKIAHNTLGLRHYSRSDFIITPKGKVYILETNSLPGLTAESLLPKSFQAVGCRPHEFIDHILKLAM